MCCSMAVRRWWKRRTRARRWRGRRGGLFRAPCFTLYYRLVLVWYRPRLNGILIRTFEVGGVCSDRLAHAEGWTRFLQGNANMLRRVGCFTAGNADRMLVDPAGSMRPSRRE